MWQWRAKKAAAAEGIVEKEGGKAPVKGGSDAPANGVVVSVPVHCDGCARKVRRSLLRLDGNMKVDAHPEFVLVLANLYRCFNQVLGGIKGLRT